MAGWTGQDGGSSDPPKTNTFVEVKRVIDVIWQLTNTNAIRQVKTAQCKLLLITSDLYVDRVNVRGVYTTSHVIFSSHFSDDLSHYLLHN